MQAVSHKKVITNVVNEIKVVSFNERRSAISQEQLINKFLDAINLLKKRLITKVSKLDHLSSVFQKITWYDDVDNDNLKLIHEIIVNSNELVSLSKREYAQLGYFRTKGIAKNEIKEYKRAIDDFKEAAEDLESVFFTLPNDIEFVNITKQLSK